MLVFIVSDKFSSRANFLDNACWSHNSLVISTFRQEHRSIARFIGYALCAADEALKDANWMPTEQNEKEQTVFAYFVLMLEYHSFCFSLVSKSKLHQGVSLGAGTGSISDILEASRMICEKVG